MLLFRTTMLLKLLIFVDPALEFFEKLSPFFDDYSMLLIMMTHLMYVIGDKKPNKLRLPNVEPTKSDMSVESLIVLLKREGINPSKILNAQANKYQARK